MEERNVGGMSAVAVTARITLRTLFWSRKTLLLGLISFIPVVLAVVCRILVGTKLADSTINLEEFYASLISLGFLRSVVVLISLFYGAALIGEESEEGTLTYLFTRPVRRWKIFLGKYLAFLLICILMIVLPLLFSFLALSVGVDPAMKPPTGLDVLFKDLGVMVLAFLAYGSVFAFLGAAFQRAVLIGLSYWAIWETVLTYVPLNIKRLSIMYYLQSLVPHMTEVNARLAIFGTLAKPATAITVLIIISFVFFVLGVVVISNREYNQ